MAKKRKYTKRNKGYWSKDSVDKDEFQTLVEFVRKFDAHDLTIISDIRSAVECECNARHYNKRSDELLVAARNLYKRLHQ